MSELLEAVARAKFRPLILSPVLFQYHTASRPTWVSRALYFPQSQLWSFQDMGTNHSFPARCL